VFQGRNRSTGELVAIKIMNPDEDGEFNLYSIETEIQFLKDFSTPFIVSFKDGFKYNDNVWVSNQ
jgi:serine/threonine protein kinase